MRAIGYLNPGSIDAPAALEEFDIQKPVPAGRDILVDVKAVAVNPVDVKLRAKRAGNGQIPEILGYDAAGIVAAVGEDVSAWKVGDPVYYAGDFTRPGTNAEFHLVDERIAGRKPESLTYAEAAALPLTGITAWEALFDRLKVTDPAPSGSATLLIVGGAGGVGSIAVQLARHLTGLTVVATASRPESRAWIEQLGAHHVIDHSRPMAPQFKELGIAAPDYVFSTTHSDLHNADIAELIAPQGRMLLIDDPQGFDIMPYKTKSVSIHWEFMFTRSLFSTPDMAKQGELLTQIAELVDAGTLKTTLSGDILPLTVENLIAVHRQIESQKSIGKAVLTGFNAS